MLLPLAFTLTPQIKEILLWVAISVAGIIVAAIVISIIQAFKADLKYIEMEISRTDGREQAHWIKKKKELWLSLIPFYRPRRRHHHHHD